MIPMSFVVSMDQLRLIEPFIRGDMEFRVTIAPWPHDSAEIFCEDAQNAELLQTVIAEVLKPSVH